MKKYIEISIRHILNFLFGLFIIYVFSTGYKCGFSGLCPKYIIWQGVARTVIVVLSIIIFLIHIDMDFKFKIKNPFYNEQDKEAWDEYQQWLKERKDAKL